MRALVLSGGGAKGAYQVGALKHLLVDRETQYDLITGVSVGALNAAFLSMFPVGQEHEAWTALDALWASIDNDRIWTKWRPFGKLRAVFPKHLGRKPSVLNSAPLKELVTRVLDVDLVRASGRQLRVGAVSVESRKYRAFDQHHPQLIEAVLASASFPLMFEPRVVDGEWWVDGGIRNLTPIKEAIQLGATEVDIIVTAPKRYPEKMYRREPDVLSLAPQVLDIMSEEIADDDLKLLVMWNAMVRAGIAPPGKREVHARIIRPETPLVDDSLNFEQTNIQMMMGIGYTDAVEAFGGE